MKFISCKNQDMPILLKIEISGIDLWEYSFEVDTSLTFRNSSKIDKSKTHDLGLAKDLNRDLHRWSFHFGNFEDTPKEVTLHINWYEKEADGTENEITKWIPDEATKNNKTTVTVQPNSGIEITDSAFYILPINAQNV